MPSSLDIQKVISTSTSDVSLADLTKKGFKHVKVLNQTVITRLIAEAVDRVLEDRSREISRGEREKVIQEARAQFEVLAKQRLEQERGRFGELERVNGALLQELDTLKKRQAAALQVQAERDQAVARVQAAEAEIEEAKALRERVASLQEAIEEKEREVSRLREETSGTSRQAAETEKEVSDLRERAGQLEASLRERDGEAARLREELAAAQRSQALAEGQLAAKNDELERLAAEKDTSQPLLQTVLQGINQRLEQVAKPSEVSQIMASLDGLSRRLSNLSAGGGGGGGLSGGGSELDLEAFLLRDSSDAVDSNISKVKVKQAKAGDVQGALARLKKLQKGGEDGER